MNDAVTIIAFIGLVAAYGGDKFKATAIRNAGATVLVAMLLFSLGTLNPTQWKSDWTRGKACARHHVSYQECDRQVVK